MRHSRTMIAGTLAGAAALGALVGAILLATGCDAPDNIYVAPDTTYAYVEPAQVNCFVAPRGSPSWLYWCDDAGARLAYIYTHPAPASYHSSSVKTYVIHHYAPAPKSASSTSGSSSWRVSMPDRKPASAPAGASAFSNRSGGSSSWFSGGASSYSSRSKSSGSSSSSSRGASSYSNRSSSGSRSSSKRP